ncbi:hypothetical protein GCK32_021484 [Trichostrongylus colubriformis]|uniref:Uncharacterized protein n=1 Tax=Trichostrongylus colubriformis TaxID=6319 RepID=A0AAN8EW76_TRICO
MICSSRTDHVVDAYLHALTAVYPRTRYQLGWDMILLFGPGSLLPSAMQDLIIKVITALVDVPTPLAMQKKISEFTFFRLDLSSYLSPKNVRKAKRYTSRALHPCLNTEK